MGKTWISKSDDDLWPWLLNTIVGSIKFSLQPFRLRLQVHKTLSIVLLLTKVTVPVGDSKFKLPQGNGCASLLPLSQESGQGMK